ncbi:carbohydrate ABC transporter permease [Leadbettera azotonutricia]|uniref:ABC transporter, permease protein n=1 Tax=Leadbettera azotonutricia (strain ATCC BAA-888 / DSM 13862 / ZAS-9) TaxID=545695 RepID=F5Y968_LEAAZ|nr:sugar ABC transporter permease [Leadbettera azotonutricia]AEF82766.1 ABC transporter, permease protein [Leadbettera azotonutricia ZAS-9]
MAGSKMVSLRSARQHSIRIAAAVFLLPALLFLIVYVAYPIVESFITSTMAWNGMGRKRVFTGAENWINLAKDINFWRAFGNNVKIMFLSLVFQVPFAMALATFLDVTERRGAVFKVVWFIPYLISSVAIGVLFKYTLDANYGVIASISKLFGGGGVDLLGNPRIALYTVIGVVCWQYIPFYMVLYLAAYGTIPVELYEAASIDGATRSQYFWRVSLPLLRPTIVSGMTLSIIGSLKYFDLIFVMTGGGPGVSTELMATYMYKLSFVRYNMGYGATVASGMFILITLVALIVISTLNRKTEL